MPKDVSFVKDIINFYDAFLDNVATSIEKLAEIQEKHKEGYRKLKDIQIDPTKLFEKFKDMNNEERRLLLDFFFQASAFESRLVMLFKLNPDEQKKLAKDLRDFLEKSKLVIKKE